MYVNNRGKTQIVNIVFTNLESVMSPSMTSRRDDVHADDAVTLFSDLAGLATHALHIVCDVQPSGAEEMLASDLRAFADFHGIDVWVNCYLDGKPVGDEQYIDTSSTLLVYLHCVTDPDTKPRVMAKVMNRHSTGNSLAVVLSSDSEPGYEIVLRSE